MNNLRLFLYNDKQDRPAFPGEIADLVENGQLFINHTITFESPDAFTGEMFVDLRNLDFDLRGEPPSHAG